MRIRKCASRLLGSAYSSAPPDQAPRFELPLPLPPPPPPPTRPCLSAPESHAVGGSFAAETASGEPCELNLSPWDLIGQLDLSDPQEEELVETYFVHVACRASWLFPISMPAASFKEETVDEGSAQPRHKVPKKTAAKKTVVKKKEKEMKESEPKKKAKVKTEEGDGEAAAGAELWTCKKNDGKRWFCQRPVSRPNSLCEYHSDQKRAYYNLFSEGISTAATAVASSAASKPSTSSKPVKPRRKKAVVDAGEGFYYYAGFGPSRSKRHCRSSSMQEPPPAEQEEEAPPEHQDAPTAGQGEADDSDHPAAARDGEPSCDDDMAGIAGGDEESSDDDTHGCNGNGEPRVVGVNGDSKRKSPLKKRWRKPVKARSLKSLM